MQKFDKGTGLLSVDKYLPHNFLAEKIILSSLLINLEAVELVLRSVKKEAFYFKNHQELYKTIIEMYKKKIPVDIITLHSFLKDNGLLEKIGGTKILIELINYVPNSASIFQFSPCASCLPPIKLPVRAICSERLFFGLWQIL